MGQVTYNRFEQSSAETGVSDMCVSNRVKYVCKCTGVTSDWPQNSASARVDRS